MEKFIKENKNIIVICVIILGLLFYWFQLRPVSIKKNCSFTTKVIPADAGITKEQAEQNKIDFEQCKLKYPLVPFNDIGGINGVSYYQYMIIIEDSTTEIQREEIKECNDTSQNTTERISSPERREKISVSEKKYSQCLREHGL